MHPAHSISSALPVQEALPLCPSPALSGLLLAAGRVDACASTYPTKLRARFWSGLLLEVPTHIVGS
jgi:hypothetical protein